MQDLSFRSLSARASRRGVPAADVRSLLRAENGRYSNLALILSDQCPWGVNVYCGGRPFGSYRGSAVELVGEAERLLIAARRSLSRDGRPARFPLMAFHEIMLNAVCHRSYCLGGDIEVDVEPAHVEVASPGPPEDMDPYLFMRTRNPALYAVLDELGLRDSSVRNQSDAVAVYSSC